MVTGMDGNRTGTDGENWSCLWIEMKAASLLFLRFDTYRELKRKVDDRPSRYRSELKS